ncbi:CCA tRNA nucleotidyltransferase [Planctomycetes bacterium K23_9]|uniref:tRNA nucleotidyltransferase/poly(A) polymerase n=1 Tax=Stieleria marina TaxID=1930275 RepID=A0A517NTK5_9BACT|nr:tRNA nucleotidyltransferase/poly(A) polymerase [Planctomycetes bacterium K23_9]
MSNDHQHKLPNEAKLFSSDAAAESVRVISTLTNAGFVAYLAGGCVRDAMLGRVPKDFDVATNATPESVREIFGKRRTLAFGASFGVIAVLPPKADRNKLSDAIPPTEVATFRSDGEYSDGRRPDSVRYGTAEEDALRRDFTINGMFYDLASRKVIDFVDGASDLQSGTLRTIGDPLDRFKEDKLRMLRAVRFATTLNFRIEEATQAAIQQFGSEISVVSGERIGAEMRKVLCSPHAAKGIQWLNDCGLLNEILPGISDVDMDRIERYLDALAIRDFPSSLACLMIAQQAATPQADAQQSKRHTAPDKAIGQIASRWKLSNEEKRQTASALTHARGIVQSLSWPWSKIQPILIDRDIGEILNVADAIIAAEELPNEAVKIAHAALQWPKEKRDPTPLLTGNDLHRYQFQAGPLFREILTETRRAQLDGEIDSHEQALEIAKRIAEGVG